MKMTKPSKNLFVVEDDPAIRDMLSKYMESKGYTVAAMVSAEDMLKRLHRLRPDLIVLDITLPGISGLEACKRLRAEGDMMPIVLLTARSEEVDRVVGLEMGADDYLGKPFSARELLARVEAVLRRSKVVPGVPGNDSREIRIGESVFSPGQRCLTVEGKVRALTTVEFSTLLELVNNPRIPISRERLLSVAHESAFDLLPRTVDVAEMRLRKLVEPDPSNPTFIQTVRGRGYMFVPGTVAQE